MNYLFLTISVFILSAFSEYIAIPKDQAYVARQNYNTTEECLNRENLLSEIFYIDYDDDGDAFYELFYDTVEQKEVLGRESSGTFYYSDLNICRNISENDHQLYFIPTKSYAQEFKQKVGITYVEYKGTRYCDTEPLDIMIDFAEEYGVCKSILGIRGMKYDCSDPNNRGYKEYPDPACKQSPTTKDECDAFGSASSEIVCSPRNHMLDRSTSVISDENLEKNQFYTIRRASSYKNCIEGNFDSVEVVKINTCIKTADDQYTRVVPASQATGYGTSRLGFVQHKSSVHCDLWSSLNSEFEFFHHDTTKSQQECRVSDGNNFYLNSGHTFEDIEADFPIGKGFKKIFQSGKHKCDDGALLAAIEVNEETCMCDGESAECQITSENTNEDADKCLVLNTEKDDEEDPQGNEEERLIGYGCGINPQYHYSLDGRYNFIVRKNYLDNSTCTNSPTETTITKINAYHPDHKMKQLSGCVATYYSEFGIYEGYKMAGITDYCNNTSEEELKENAEFFETDSSSECTTGHSSYTYNEVTGQQYYTRQMVQDVFDEDVGTGIFAVYYTPGNKEEGCIESNLMQMKILNNYSCITSQEKRFNIDCSNPSTPMVNYYTDNDCKNFEKTEEASCLKVENDEDIEYINFYCGFPITEEQPVNPFLAFLQSDLFIFGLIGIGITIGVVILLALLILIAVVVCVVIQKSKGGYVEEFEMK